DNGNTENGGNTNNGSENNGNNTENSGNTDNGNTDNGGNTDSGNNSNENNGESNENTTPDNNLKDFSFSISANGKDISEETSNNTKFNVTINNAKADDDVIVTISKINGSKVEEIFNQVIISDNEGKANIEFNLADLQAKIDGEKFVIEVKDANNNNAHIVNSDKTSQVISVDNVGLDCIYQVQEYTKNNTDYVKIWVSSPKEEGKFYIVQENGHKTFAGTLLPGQTVGYPVVYQKGMSILVTDKYGNEVSKSLDELVNATHTPSEELPSKNDEVLTFDSLKITQINSDETSTDKSALVKENKLTINGVLENFQSKAQEYEFTIKSNLLNNNSTETKVNAYVDEKGNFSFTLDTNITTNQQGAILISLNDKSDVVKIILHNDDNSQNTQEQPNNPDDIVDTKPENKPEDTPS
ncbi:hypothetical protein, partial [Campylobacter canadensis]